MKGLVTVLAVLVVLGLAYSLYMTPTAPPEMTDAERAQIEADVLNLAEAWMDVWRANHCELARDILSPDRLALPVGGRADTSVSDWIDYCTRTIENRAGWSGEWTDTDVRVLSPDAALFVGTYAGTYTYRDGSPARHYPTSAQVILAERTDTGWSITTFLNSNSAYEEVEGG